MAWRGDRRDWVERQPHVIPYVVYILLRLVLEHSLRLPLRDREIELAATLLRTRVRPQGGALTCRMAQA